MSEVGLAEPSFGERLLEVLRSGLERVNIRATVETEPVPTTRLFRALVTSSQFRQMDLMERQEVVWRILGEALTADERLRVSMVVAATPRELGSTPPRKPSSNVGGQRSKKATQ